MGWGQKGVHALISLTNERVTDVGRFLCTLVSSMPSLNGSTSVFQSSMELLLGLIDFAHRRYWYFLEALSLLVTRVPCPWNMTQGVILIIVQILKLLFCGGYSSLKFPLKMLLSVSFHWNWDVIIQQCLIYFLITENWIHPLQKCNYLITWRNSSIIFPLDDGTERDNYLSLTISIIISDKCSQIETMAVLTIPALVRYSFVCFFLLPKDRNTHNICC